MFVEKSISVKAATSKVWEVLTKPEFTKQYMFGCEVISDWKIGSSIIWKGHTEDGKEMVYVKGKILEIEHGKKIKFTMLDPNMGIKDIPENYVNLTYLIENSDEKTLLKVIQGDFSNVEKKESRYEDTVKGWDYVLPVMKELIEKD